MQVVTELSHIMTSLTLTTILYQVPAAFRPVRGRDLYPPCDVAPLHFTILFSFIPARYESLDSMRKSDSSSDVPSRQHFQRQCP